LISGFQDLPPIGTIGGIISLVICGVSITALECKFNGKNQKAITEMQDLMLGCALLCLIAGITALSVQASYSSASAVIWVHLSVTLVCGLCQMVYLLTLPSRFPKMVHKGDQSALTFSWCSFVWTQQLSAWLGLSVWTSAGCDQWSIHLVFMILYGSSLAGSLISGIRWMKMLWALLTAASLTGLTIASSTDLTFILLLYLLLNRVVHGITGDGSTIWSGSLRIVDGMSCSLQLGMILIQLWKYSDEMSIFGTIIDLPWGYSLWAVQLALTLINRFSKESVSLWASEINLYSWVLLLISMWCQPSSHLEWGGEIACVLITTFMVLILHDMPPEHEYCPATIGVVVGSVMYSIKSWMIYMREEDNAINEPALKAHTCLIFALLLILALAIKSQRVALGRIPHTVPLLCSILIFSSLTSASVIYLDLGRSLGMLLYMAFIAFSSNIVPDDVEGQALMRCVGTSALLILIGGTDTILFKSEHWITAIVFHFSRLVSCHFTMSEGARKEELPDGVLSPSEKETVGLTPVSTSIVSDEVSDGLPDAVVQASDHNHMTLEEEDVQEEQGNQVLQEQVTVDATNSNASEMLDLKMDVVYGYLVVADEPPAFSIIALMICAGKDTDPTVWWLLLSLAAVLSYELLLAVHNSPVHPRWLGLLACSYAAAALPYRAMMADSSHSVQSHPHTEAYIFSFLLVSGVIAIIATAMIRQKATLSEPSNGWFAAGGIILCGLMDFSTPIALIPCLVLAHWQGILGDLGDWLTFIPGILLIRGLEGFPHELSRLTIADKSIWAFLLTGIVCTWTAIVVSILRRRGFGTGAGTHFLSIAMIGEVSVGSSSLVVLLIASERGWDALVLVLLWACISSYYRDWWVGLFLPAFSLFSIQYLVEWSGAACWTSVLCTLSTMMSYLYLHNLGKSVHIGRGMDGHFELLDVQKAFGATLIWALVLGISAADYTSGILGVLLTWSLFVFLSVKQYWSVYENIQNDTVLPNSVWSNSLWTALFASPALISLAMGLLASENNVGDMAYYFSIGLPMLLIGIFFILGALCLDELGGLALPTDATPGLYSKDLRSMQEWIGITWLLVGALPAIALGVSTLLFALFLFIVGGIWLGVGLKTLSVRRRTVGLGCHAAVNLLSCIGEREVLTNILVLFIVCITIAEFVKLRSFKRVERLLKALRPNSNPHNKYGVEEEPMEEASVGGEAIESICGCGLNSQDSDTHMSYFSLLMTLVAFIFALVDMLKNVPPPPPGYVVCGVGFTLCLLITAWLETRFDVTQSPLSTCEDLTLGFLGILAQVSLTAFFWQELSEHPTSMEWLWSHVILTALVTVLYAGYLRSLSRFDMLQSKGGPFSLSISILAPFFVIFLGLDIWPTACTAGNCSGFASASFVCMCGALLAARISHKSTFISLWSGLTACTCLILGMIEGATVEGETAHVENPLILFLLSSGMHLARASSNLPRSNWPAQHFPMLLSLAGLQITAWVKGWEISLFGVDVALPATWLLYAGTLTYVSTPIGPFFALLTMFAHKSIWVQMTCVFFSTLVAAEAQWAKGSLTSAQLEDIMLSDLRRSGEASSSSTAFSGTGSGGLPEFGGSSVPTVERESEESISLVSPRLDEEDKAKVTLIREELHDVEQIFLSFSRAERKSAEGKEKEAAIEKLSERLRLGMQGIFEKEQDVMEDATIHIEDVEDVVVPGDVEDEDLEEVPPSLEHVIPVQEEETVEEAAEEAVEEATDTADAIEVVEVAEDMDSTAVVSEVSAAAEAAAARLAKVGAITPAALQAEPPIGDAISRAMDEIAFQSSVFLNCVVNPNIYSSLASLVFCIASWLSWSMVWDGDSTRERDAGLQMLCLLSPCALSGLKTYMIMSKSGTAESLTLSGPLDGRWDVGASWDLAFIVVCIVASAGSMNSYVLATSLLVLTLILLALSHHLEQSIAWLPVRVSSTCALILILGVHHDDIALSMHFLAAFFMPCPSYKILTIARSCVGSSSAYPRSYDGLHLTHSHVSFEGALVVCFIGAIRCSGDALGYMLILPCVIIALEVSHIQAVARPASLLHGPLLLSLAAFHYAASAFPYRMELGNEVSNTGSSMNDLAVYMYSAILATGTIFLTFLVAFNGKDTEEREQSEVLTPGMMEHETDSPEAAGDSSSILSSLAPESVVLALMACGLVDYAMPTALIPCFALAHWQGSMIGMNKQLIFIPACVLLRGLEGLFHPLSRLELTDASRWAEIIAGTTFIWTMLVVLQLRWAKVQLEDNNKLLAYGEFMVGGASILLLDICSERGWDGLVMIFTWGIISVLYQDWWMAFPLSFFSLFSFAHIAGWAGGACWTSVLCIFLALVLTVVDYSVVKSPDMQDAFWSLVFWGTLFGFASESYSRGIIGAVLSILIFISAVRYRAILLVFVSPGVVLVSWMSFVSINFDDSVDQWLASTIPCLLLALSWEILVLTGALEREAFVVVTDKITSYSTKKILEGTSIASFQFGDAVNGVVDWDRFLTMVGYLPIKTTSGAPILAQVGTEHVFTASTQVLYRNSPIYEDTTEKSISSGAKVSGRVICGSDGGTFIETDAGFLPLSTDTPGMRFLILEADGVVTPRLSTTDIGDGAVAVDPKKAAIQEKKRQLKVDLAKAKRKKELAEKKEEVRKMMARQARRGAKDMVAATPIVTGDSSKPASTSSSVPATPKAAPIVAPVKVASYLRSNPTVQYLRRVCNGQLGSYHSFPWLVDILVETSGVGWTFICGFRGMFFSGIDSTEQLATMTLLLILGAALLASGLKEQHSLSRLRVSFRRISGAMSMIAGIFCGVGATEGILQAVLIMLGSLVALAFASLWIAQVLRKGSAAAEAEEV